MWQRPAHEEQVQLTITGDDGERVITVSVGDALRLAAALTRACAVADRLDQDFNDARARRQADR